MPKGENNRKLSDAQRDEIVRLYETRLDDGTWLGTTSIARMFSVSPNAIQTFLRTRGVTMRTSKEAHAHGKRCGPPGKPRGEAPLCKCGCGLRTTWTHSKCRWRYYVVGHYRSDASYKSREWLLTEYVERNRSVSEIAADFGVGRQSVTKQMKRHGIARRRGSAAHVGRQAGANNPAWKGGVTPARQRIYKSQEWKVLLLEVWRRDGFLCVRCRHPKKGRRSLHTHHVKPWANAPELRTDPDNLVTLCRVCHLWVHSRENITGLFLA